MADIDIEPYDDTFCSVLTDSAIEREISDYLSFVIPGSEFMRRGRRRHWDGRIRLYNRTTKLTYVGLVRRIVRWAEKHEYSVQVHPGLNSETDWNYHDTDRLFKTYPPPMQPRPYQRDGITMALRHQRLLLISPTGSGKSLIIYYILRANPHVKCLLVVPTISLVTQMVNDFREYGWDDVDDHVHQIYSGQEKTTDKPITVSTWQSIYKLDADWFAAYRVVVGDECHHWKADSFKAIMEKLPNCPVKIGLTGTLDNGKANRLVVEGVFGPPFKVAKTADLQTMGHLTPIKVQAHVLRYGDYDAWRVREHYRKYQEELDYIVQHPERMQFTVDMVTKLKGNVLVLFNFIEKHGVPLHTAIKTAVGNTRPVHYVSGQTDKDTRENIRQLLEQSSDAILVASYGTFSTGINIKKLHFVVFASPSKSRYRVLQSIGRGLRLHTTKKVVYVMDIVDDFHRKEYTNYLFKHWAARRAFYDEEQFPVDTYIHTLGEGRLA